MNFNLVRDPWIPALDVWGKTRLYSLREIFLNAYDLRDLACTAPGEQAAMTRLLIALATRAWNGKAGYAEQVAAYLSQYEGRFELFGPQPFLQAPPAATKALTSRTVALLRSGVPAGNNVSMGGQHFDARPQAITPAQAARALITSNHYAISSGKSAFGHSLDAPASRAATFTLCARTLLITLQANVTACVKGDTPIWEEGDPTEWGHPRARKAPGMVRAVAWPWRACTLRPDEDGLVRWIAYAAGDTPIPGQDSMMATLTSKKEEAYAPKIEDTVDNLLARLLEANALPANVQAYLAAADGSVTHVAVAGQVTNQSAVLDMVYERRPVAEFSCDPARVAATKATQNAVWSAIYQLRPTLKPGEVRELGYRAGLHTLHLRGEIWQDAGLNVRRITERLPRSSRSWEAGAVAKAVLGARRRDFLSGGEV